MPFFEGGDEGGVVVCDCVGEGPVGQVGMYLLGTGVGLRGLELRLRAGVRGGGGEPCRTECC